MGSSVAVPRAAAVLGDEFEQIELGDHAHRLIVIGDDERGRTRDGATTPAARAANPALRAAAHHAEALARAQSSVTAVSIRDRDETRVSDVFDFGPPLGFRARVGEAIQLVPPFVVL